MRTRITCLAPSLALALVLGIAGTASAAENGSRQDATLKFTSKQPGSPTGLVLRIDYVNPGDPQAKPPAVRRVVEGLAPGARFDTSAPELCTASDPELMLLGAAACRAGSKVGEGLLTFDTGLPQPGRFLASPVEFFNNTNEFIFLNRVAATESPRVVTRAEVGERSYTAEAPFLPGTPPDGTAVDTVSVREPVLTREVDGELRSYITTPPRCPKRGFWRNKVTFTYDDGVEQTVVSRSRCKCKHPLGNGRKRR